MTYIPPIFNISLHSTCYLKCEFCMKAKGDYDRYKPIEYDQFTKYIDALADYGTSIFELTPTVGDAFSLSPPVLEQYLDYLEDKQSVDVYFFYTSLITKEPMSNGQFDFLFNRDKFILHISLYAVNKKEFMRRTSGTEEQFDILKSNLFYIIQNIDKFQIDLSDRTTFGNSMARMNMDDDTDVPTSKPSPAFKYIINALCNSPRVSVDSSPGTMIDHDYTDTVTKTAKSNHDGVCIAMLMDNGVYPDGKVSLCSWIDSRREMTMGNLNDNSLDEIYKDYWDEEGEKPKLNEQSLKFDKKFYVCNNCDFALPGPPGKTIEEKSDALRTEYIQLLNNLRDGKGHKHKKWF